jgi:hypothetical protein
MKRRCATALHKFPAYTAAGHMRSVQLALHQDRFAGACTAPSAWAGHPQDRLAKWPATCGLPGNSSRIRYSAVRIGDVHQLERIAHVDRATRKTAAAKTLTIEAGDMRHHKSPLLGPISNLWTDANRSRLDQCQCRVGGCSFIRFSVQQAYIGPLGVACWSVLTTLAMATPFRSAVSAAPRPSG